MQTRQRASKGAGLAAATTKPINLEKPIDSGTSDSWNTSYNPVVDVDTGLGMAGSIVEEPQVDWVQQMHDLEDIQWRGGDAFYDGPHDSFCFVCGSTMELFACQTCENCYHAECMSPSLDPNEVPKFWFCPHCVDRELHVPTSLDEVDGFDPHVQVTSIYPSPLSIVSPEKQSDSIIHPTVIRHQASGTQPNPINRISASPSLQNNNPLVQPDKGHPVKLAAKSRSRPSESIERSKPGRSKRSLSPPRKKSKYSTFSIEVDKALSVLYSELETAAHCGRSEDNLQSKVQDLEQTVKLQEGQILLSGREIEVLRKKLAEQRTETENLTAENAGFKNELMSLREQLQQKEAELKDWRVKLRTMMGGELE